MVSANMQALDGATDLLPDQAQQQSAMNRGQRIRAIVGASSGNLVEWFDFFAYAFTSIYFASSFFPSGDQTSQLLATTGIFAVGFVMRPLGGWLFGWLADSHGRKNSMMVSVMMMCGGSLMIALLPTHASIGMWAPALLLVARLLQGLSVGGEYGTAATYMSEVATKGSRGFFSSFQYVTIVGGQLLALLVVFILQQTLSLDELREWGWRVPFFIGAAGAVVAAYMRRALRETASDTAMHRKEAGSIKALLSHKRAVLVTFGLTMGGSLYFYTFTTYMQKFLVNTVKLPAASVSTVMTGCLIVFMCLQPLFGSLSDRIGRKKSLIAFTSLAVVSVVPILTGLQTATNLWVTAALVMASLVIACFYTSISGVVKAELFPSEVRALGVGLPYAIANAAFGGTAEYVALSLKSAGWEAWFPWYVTAVVAVAWLTCVFWMPDTSKYGHLDGDGTA
jgi:MHS family alpha-ketoglutarate permease-like MFS transporter